MPDLEEGQKFERYRVVRMLGQGVAGVSYEAEDMLLRRHVTLKLIHPWARLPDSARRQFFRDMQSISLLAHPYQATTLDYGEVDGQLYTVRRFTAPGSLLNAEGRAWFAPPLTVSAAITYTHQLAQALYNIHRYGYVHGSLTLANILVLQQVEAPHEAEATPFLLADAGMAHFVRRFGHPKIARLPITSAPEQARGRVTPACDQYALAAILYFWLAGRPPFIGSPEEIDQAKRTASFPVLPSQNPHVTFQQEGIIRRALSAYPEERHTSVLAFAEALLTSLAHMQTPVPNTIKTEEASAITSEPIAISTPANALIEESVATPEEVSSAYPTYEKATIEQPEPVSTTFIIDQQILNHFTEILRPAPVAEAPKPLPRIEPEQPLPHPDPLPPPQPAPPAVPEKEPSVPEAPRPEPDVIPPPAPDIAQPLPEETPPGIVPPVQPPEIPAEPAKAPQKPPETPKNAEQLPVTDELSALPEEITVLASLTIIAPDGVQDEEVMLTHGKTTLGRAGSNDILLDKDSLTSRRHAYIQYEDGRYALYDHDSNTGVILNDLAITPGTGHPLADGDRFQIGEYRLVFHLKVTPYSEPEALSADQHVHS